jgi:hypothetical protein
VDNKPLVILRKPRNLDGSVGSKAPARGNDHDDLFAEIHFGWLGWRSPWVKGVIVRAISPGSSPTLSCGNYSELWRRWSVIAALGNRQELEVNRIALRIGLHPGSGTQAQEDEHNGHDS